jgi:adenylylsulfate kinase
MKKIDITKGRKIIFWLTGLPASGKTTLSQKISEKLKKHGYNTKIIDGDEIRKQYKDEHGRALGFSKQDRIINLNTAIALSDHYAKNGIAIIALISPYQCSRQFAKKQLENSGNHFIEIFLSCPLSKCESRDPKGLYKKARQGEIKNFTGINDPYEPPANPDIILFTDIWGKEDCLLAAFAQLKY